MSETEPFFASSEHLFDFNDVRRDSQNITTGSKETITINHEKTKKNQNQRCSNKSIFDCLRLYRSMDCIDLILIGTGSCAVVIYAVVFIINTYLLATIPAFFTNFHSETENTSVSSLINDGCPLGIDLNALNRHRFEHLCKLPVKIENVSTKILHEKIMSKIRLIFIFASIEMIATFIQYFTFAVTAERQITRIRKLVLRSLLQRNSFYYDHHEVGRLNTKMSQNLETIKRGIGTELSVLFVVILLIVFGAIVSFVINWRFTMISAFLIPLLCGGFSIFSKIVADETEKELTTYSKAGHIFEEVIGSFRTVLSLNGSEFEQKRYAKEMKKTRWNAMKKGGVFGIFMSWTYFIAYLIYFAAFMLISHLITIHQCPNFNITDKIVVLSLSTEVIAYIANLGPVFQLVGEAWGASKDVLKLLDETEIDDINEPDVWNYDNFEKQNSDASGDIEFSGVNFSYPTRSDASVVRNLNFIARKGEKIALVGRSGSGKSTCLSLLLRFYEPSSGMITIGGQSITKYSLRNLRRSIGVVNQEPVLFNTSIYENILHGKPNATQHEIEEAARQANAHDFIMALPNKYETKVGENGAQLSGGEKQRIALARTLIRQPKILLLDEPTSALDVQNQRLVQDALSRACTNRTTIVIAHRLSTIRDVDRIYVLQNGTIVEEGNHDTLLEREKGIYKEMCALQQVGLADNYENVDVEMNEDLLTKMNTKTDDNQKGSKSSWIDEKKTYDSDKRLRYHKSVNKTHVFWRLLHMNKPEWIYMMIGCILSTLSGTSEIMFAYLLTDILRSYSDCVHMEQYHHAIVFSYVFISIGVLALFLRFFQFAAFATSGASLTERLRTKAFAALLRQEVAYFDRQENSTSAISARLFSGAQTVQQTMGTLLAIICETFSMLILGLIVGLLFNYQITFIMSVAIVIITIVVSLDVQLKKRIFQKSQVYLQCASGIAGEAMHNMRTVKLLMIENNVLERYSKLVDQSLAIHIYPTLLSAAAFTFYLSTYGFIVASMYWCALLRLERQLMSAQDAFMIFGYTIFFLHFLQQLWIIEDGLGASFSAAEVFFDLFDRVPVIDNSSTEGQTLDEVQGNIEFDCVKFSYPSHSSSSNIVNDLRFTIKAGQRVALVGASGCGKSTVIQLLQRFYDATDGRIYFDGVDIRQLNIQWLRSCLGLVHQEPTLFDLTIAENIMYNLKNVSREQIYSVAKKANIHDFILTLPEGYNTRVGRKGMLLSGGEKQRIAIARILLRQPQVLLFDEATSALDSYNEQMVQRSIDHIHTDKPGQTMLIIAHNLTTIRSCDAILVLKRGRIVEMGIHEELMHRRGIYHRLIVENS